MDVALCLISSVCNAPFVCPPPSLNYLIAPFGVFLLFHSLASPLPPHCHVSPPPCRSAFPPLPPQLQLFPLCSHVLPIVAQYANFVAKRHSKRHHTLLLKATDTRPIAPTHFENPKVETSMREVLKPMTVPTLQPSPHGVQGG